MFIGRRANKFSSSGGATRNADARLVGLPKVRLLASGNCCARMPPNGFGLENSSPSNRMHRSGPRDKAGALAFAPGMLSPRPRSGQFDVDSRPARTQGRAQQFGGRIWRSVHAAGTGADRARIVSTFCANDAGPVVE